MKDQNGQVIQYIDGWAWGITPEGRTVCLGTEPDIKAILANPRRHPENPTIAQVISVERHLFKQEEKKDKGEQKKVEERQKERHKLAEELGVAKMKKPRD